MKQLTEQELAEIFHAVLSRPTQTVRRLRLRLREEGQRNCDELVQFRLLQRACREDSSLALSLEQAGLGPVATYALDPPSAEVGQLIQAFNCMVEDYWDEDGARVDLHRTEQVDSSTLMPRRGTGGFNMEVRVHAGKNLVVRDLFTSDPYCVLIYEDSSYDIVQRSQTEVQRNTCDPFWKDIHHFTHVHATGKLTIEIWDKDFTGGDDPMGKVEIPMEELDFRQESHAWYPVQEAESGQLRVRIQFSRAKAH